MTYSWNFEPIWQFSHAWARGLFNTIWLAVLIVVFGTLLALVLVSSLKSRNRLLITLARVYIDLFRAIPALVLLGTLFFVLPIFVGLRLSPFQVAVIGLTLNLAPFVAEVIRSAVDSVPSIQYDSALVMGFRGWKRDYYIIAPQVLQRLLPPLVGEYVTTLKLTSLAATIGVEELWNVTSQITTQTSLPLETRIVGATLYVAVILPLLILSFWLERRFGVKGLGEATER